MIYIALLRGVNVGGKGIVSMATLKDCFEAHGFTSVKTYINSGNIMFSAPKTATEKLAEQLEKAIERGTKLHVKVLVKTLDQLQVIASSVPKIADDPAIRCYVLFLWPTADSPSVLQNLPSNPELETLQYVPGAVVHTVAKKDAAKGRLSRVAGTPLYQDITMRNITTVRKLVTLASQL